MSRRLTGSSQSFAGIRCMSAGPCRPSIPKSGAACSSSRDIVLRQGYSNDRYSSPFRHMRPAWLLAPLGEAHEHNTHFV